ncbi:MAG TPA: MBL fold metallo-hydrolase [Candidatus Limnocylindria bacterium]|nr:MBL fold metallo-hydrolase [Candidatus Limnocylindria bacterium]
MEIQYFGANCVRISTKKASVIVDDNLPDLGQKSVTKNGEIALFTGPHGDPSPKVDKKIVIDQPGEYEVADTSIQGIAAQAHIDEAGQKNATIFKIVDDDIRVVVTGHIYPELTDDQLESLGMVDVLIIPIGGNGYTLDGVGALKLIRKVDPKIVIPTHFDEEGFTFPVPQQPLSDALKPLAMEPKETVAKLKVKPAELTDTTQLIILER